MRPIAEEMAAHIIGESAGHVVRHSKQLLTQGHGIVVQPILGHGRPKEITVTDGYPGTIRRQSVTASVSRTLRRPRFPDIQDIIHKNVRHSVDLSSRGHPVA